MKYFGNGIDWQLDRHADRFWHQLLDFVFKIGVSKVWIFLFYPNIIFQIIWETVKISLEEIDAPEGSGSLDHVTVELDDALCLAVRAVLRQQDLHHLDGGVDVNDGGQTSLWL